jgi:hypothetical protein
LVSLAFGAVFSHWRKVSAGLPHLSRGHQPFTPKPTSLTPFGLFVKIPLRTVTYRLTGPELFCSEIVIRSAAVRHRAGAMKIRHVR